MASRNSSSSSAISRKKGKQWECPYCQITFPEDTKSLKCDTCGSWVCLPCTKIPEEMYDVMHKLNDKKGQTMNGFKWVCKLDEKTLPTLKEMNSTLVSIRESNNERFDAIEMQVRDIEGSIGVKVADEVASMKDQLRSDISKEIDRKMEERYQEENERKFREMNLCLFNVPISSDDNPEMRKNHDKNIVTSLFQAVVKDDRTKEPQIKNLFRLKRPEKTPEGSGDKLPVLKVTFVNKHELRLFLSNSRSIKGNKDLSSDLQKIIVTKDLSPKQRQDSKRLRAELVEKNSEGGERYTIRNGRIVPKGKGARDPATPSE